MNGHLSPLELARNTCGAQNWPPLAAQFTDRVRLGRRQPGSSTSSPAAVTNAARTGSSGTSAITAWR